jgi:hypothetical protein
LKTRYRQQDQPLDAEVEEHGRRAGHLDGA